MKSIDLNGTTSSNEKSENELVTKAPTSPSSTNYTRFKLRAECIHDVFQFIRSHKIKSLWHIKIEQEEQYPDVDLEFNTQMTLKEILIILSKIPDSQVMMDTISPVEKYTGKRRHIDWVNVKIDDEFVSNFEINDGFTFKGEYPDLTPNPMLFLFERIFEFLVKKETDFYIFTEKELENIVKGFSKAHEDILDTHLDFLATEYKVIDYRVVQDNKGSRIYPIWLINSEFNFPLEFADVFKSKRENTRIFKLKTRLIQDFMKFFIFQPCSIRNINIEFQLGEYVLEFTTNMSLEEILIILKDIEDDPLMMETVNYIEKYTGDRIFGDWHKITDDENLISILNGARPKRN